MQWLKVNRLDTQQANFEAQLSQLLGWESVSDQRVQRAAVAIWIRGHLDPSRSRRGHLDPSRSRRGGHLDPSPLTGPNTSLFHTLAITCKTACHGP